MYRSFILAFVVAGCGSFQASSTQSPSGASPRQPLAGDEVHRGLLTNQKSSPDSGQASEGGGGRGGAGGSGAGGSGAGSGGGGGGGGGG